MGRINNSQHVSLLLAEVEQKMGRSMETPSDFQHLIDSLPEDAPLSMSTLKRLWQYVGDKHEPRESTLAILSQFLGYKDWNDFHSKHTDSSDSGFLSGIDIEKDIECEADLELSWFPNRLCVIRKIDKQQVRVVKAENCKLQVGDVFCVTRLEEGCPMIATHFTRNGERLPDYVAARKKGLASVLVLDNMI